MEDAEKVMRYPTKETAVKHERIVKEPSRRFRRSSGSECAAVYCRALAFLRTSASNCGRNAEYPSSAADRSVAINPIQQIAQCNRARHQGAVVRRWIHVKLVIG
jgi:hypothetical protein